MPRPAAGLYRFGPYTLDALRRVLARDDEVVPLPSKAFDLLVALVQHSNQVMSKGELLRLVWNETAVEEQNLTQTVFVLRKALGERPTEHRYIVTIPGVGYRFVAHLKEDARGGEPYGADAGANTASVLRSIAVLPFTGLGAAAADEYLELGITDALITKLGSVRQVVVRPTTAVLKYHRQHHDPALAARELRVDAIIDGTIQRAGDRLRVAVHVMRGDATTLWAGSFDENLTDLFAVEDSIADQVARALVLTLSEEDRLRLAKRSTDNTDAYHAYLKGRFFWNKRSEDGLKRGITFFERAIALDPNYAAAYAGLADCYNLLSAYGALPPKDGYPRASAAALRALAIDNRMAEAHTSLAYATLHFYWNWDAAGQAFQQALALNGNYATAHQWYAAYLTALGRFPEASAEIQRALTLDPLSLIINADVGWLLYFARDHDAAIGQLHKTIEMDPTFAVAHWLLGLNYAQNNLVPDAVAAFERATALSQDMPFAVASLAHVLAKSGARDAALAIREQLVVLSTRRYVSAHSMATLHAGLGDATETIKWLRTACDERSDRLVFLNVDPAFDLVRDDSRFQQIVDRVGFRTATLPH